MASQKKVTATILSFEVWNGISGGPTWLVQRWFDGSAQNSLLWPWLFFVTPIIFCNGPKISAVCQLSAVITPENWPLAHSSVRRSCSKFFKTHAENSNTFKNMGVRPPQSQLIRICVPQKSCFLATFFGKILVLTHFDPTYPPHDIHRWKAMDLTLHVV